MLLIATILIEKIPNTTSATQYYQFYLKRKHTILVTQSKIITQQPKTFQNPNTDDIQSVTIEHPQTSLK